MKVAVCVSGVCKGGNPNNSLIRNNTILKNKFSDADFYYATWNDYSDEFKKTFPNEICQYFTQPTMDYHPYDIPKIYHISPFYQETVNWINKGGTKRREWSSHHTKQILIHTWLLSTIEKEYDVIVRTRFDGFIHSNANFSTYLEDTFKHHRANCFGATRKHLFDQLREVDMSPKSLHSNWILDQLIIHNSDAIDIDKVNLLHKEKRLHAAEYGWYQVISMHNGSNHINHSGWVNHDKNVLDKFLQENK